MKFYVLVCYPILYFDILFAIFAFQQLKNKFLIIKAKYYGVEPHYMEGTTPDQLCLTCSGTLLFEAEPD